MVLDQPRHHRIRGARSMKRLQYYILLAPALLAALVSPALLFFSWRYHAMYLSGEMTVKRVEEKLNSRQCLAPGDLDFIVAQIHRNHQHLQDTADMYWRTGTVFAAFAILIAFSVYRASMRLTYKGP
jgi:hypothetical protein